MTPFVKITYQRSETNESELASALIDNNEETMVFKFAIAL